MSLRFMTKSDAMYEELCAAILRGKLLPGQHINADELARQYGISKIPVREAIQKLEMNGMVVQTPHAGARVAPLSFREMRGIFLIRGALESLATRLAATTIGASDLQQLDKLCDDLEAHLSQAQLDPIFLSELNRQFHGTIARATGYRVLQESIEANLLNVMRYRVGIQRVIGDWQQALAEHKQIVSALRAGDVNAAESCAKTHCENQMDLELKAQFDLTLFVDAPHSEL